MTVQNDGVRNKSNEEKEKKKKKKRSKKNMECWKCHEKGHFASECGEKRGNDEPRDACDCAFIGGQSGGVIESEQVKCASSSCLSVKEVQEADNNDIWFTDSGASAHMTFHRDWLEEYREEPRGGTVVLGDNEECEVAGRGTVRIEKFASCAWQKAKIENVLYVPK